MVIQLYKYTKKPLNDMFQTVSYTAFNLSKAWGRPGDMGQVVPRVFTGMVSEHPDRETELAFYSRKWPEVQNYNIKEWSSFVLPA